MVRGDKHCRLENKIERGGAELFFTKKMEDLLKSYMEQAEEAGLPEGDYLKVCNALKQSFEKIKIDTPKEIVHNVEFTLEFTCELGQSVFINISKSIIVLGPGTNKLVYTFRATKDGDVIKEHVNKICTLYQFNNMIKQIVKIYRFDKFRITTDVACNTYTTKRIAEIEHARYKHLNSLGSVYNDDDDDHEPWHLEYFPHLEFIRETYASIVADVI
jgi:hypothetical protein